MATNTPNLVLRKPDGADLVNVITDLDDNYDKIDLLLGIANIVWETFVPVWSSTGAAPALGNGVITGRFKKVGKTVVFEVRLITGTTSTYGAPSWYFTLPWVPKNSNERTVNAMLIDVSTGARYPSRGLVTITTGPVGLVYPLSLGVVGANVVGNLCGPLNPFTWANGDTIIIEGVIEVE